MNNFKFDVPAPQFSTHPYVSYFIAGSDPDGSTMWVNRVYPVHDGNITLTPIPKLPQQITAIITKGVS